MGPHHERKVLTVDSETRAARDRLAHVADLTTDGGFPRVSVDLARHATLFGAEEVMNTIDRHDELVRGLLAPDIRTVLAALDRQSDQIIVTDAVPTEAEAGDPRHPHDRRGELMNPQPDPTPDESAAAVTAFLAGRDEYRASLRPGARSAVGDVITAAIHTANIEVHQGATSFELDTTELRESHLRGLLRLLGGAREKVDSLTDRVITAEENSQDTADLEAENAELRRQLADAPTTNAAIERLREWVPDYEVGATHVAMPVATARKLLDEASSSPREREREYDLHRVTMVATSDGTVRPQHVEHIPACDALRYGVQCHFDHLVVDQGRGWPQEPGVYVAYVNPIREPCLRYDRIGSAPGEASPATPDRETEATP